MLISDEFEQAFIVGGISNAFALLDGGQGHLIVGEWIPGPGVTYDDAGDTFQWNLPTPAFEEISPGIIQSIGGPFSGYATLTGYLTWVGFTDGEGILHLAWMVGTGPYDFTVSLPSIEIGASVSVADVNFSAEVNGVD